MPPPTKVATIKPKAPKIHDIEDQFQRETRDAFRQLLLNPLLKGVLLENVNLTTGTTRVAHRLGRPARGFFVVDMTSNQRVWRDGSDTTSPNVYISLIATAAVTVSLLVF